MAYTLEETLKQINKEKIQMKDCEITQNNMLLGQVTDSFIKEFKKDTFFKSIYQAYFFGGSFYDGLKVGRPNEFDIDLLFTLPVIATPTILTDDNHPGFVQVRLPNLKELEKVDYPPFYKDMLKLVNDDNYLVIDKIMKWFQSKVDNAKSALDRNLDYELVTTTVTKGPAITFKIRDKHSYEEFDVDFVPCFKFSISEWPDNCREVFWENPNDQLTKSFLVVPKPKDAYSNTYFRLSFQGQERYLINDKGHLKPAIRLFKLYRDVYNDSPIKSYFLKTLALWALEDPGFRYKSTPMSVIFMQLLDKLIQAVEYQRLPYYWNQNFNLFPDCSSTFLRDLSNRLKQHKKVFQSGDAEKIKKVFRIESEIAAFAESFGDLGISNTNAQTAVQEDSNLGWWGLAALGVGIVATGAFALHTYKRGSRQD